MKNRITHKPIKIKWPPYYICSTNQRNTPMKVSCLDVHKDTVFCAVYNGKKYTPVKEYATFTSSIHELGDYLKQEKVKKISIESTGIYWIPVWNILENQGFELILVNPYIVKQMPVGKAM